MEQVFLKSTRPSQTQPLAHRISLELSTLKLGLEVYRIILICSYSYIYFGYP